MEHHLAVVAIAVPAPVLAVTAGMRAEDEPGEEDHRDDEHHARGDAHPGHRLRGPA
jgi:hypothetical protein